MILFCLGNVVFNLNEFFILLFDMALQVFNLVRLHLQLVSDNLVTQLSGSQFSDQCVDFELFDFSYLQHIFRLQCYVFLNWIQVQNDIF